MCAAQTHHFFNFQYKEELCVALFDLLGFKHFIDEDIEGAMEMLNDTRHICRTKLSDDKLFTPDDYPTEEFAKLSNENGVSSFTISIPFSDSLILFSRDPSLFAVQLVHYINGCFTYTSHVFNDTHGGNPMDVNISNVSRSDSGQIEVNVDIKK